MSVPFPSPSPLSTMPRARPTPISTDARRAGDPAASVGSQTARSIGFGLSSGNGESWRDRMGVEKPRSAGSKQIGGFGFEKKEVRPANGAVSALGSSREKERAKEPKEGKEDAKAGLAHVPCRFFKAGACTAGDDCPFSHTAVESGKKEVCQWYLKGNCKFGHKCALAHVKPGEPLSMDRKNKRAAQMEAREKLDPPRSDITSPVPIRSAPLSTLSSSIQSPSARMASSPMREPYGPPPVTLAGSPSAGFLHGKPVSQFPSSPSRPSPLSASVGGRPSVPAPLSLKSTTAAPIHSPLRPPPTAFSSSFSHASLSVDRSGRPMSASLVDSTLSRSIWARQETPDEPLSPARRPIKPLIARPVHGDVFDEDDGYGEDLLPSSLSELLTPMEKARRMSRRDSQDSFSGSPGRSAFYGNGHAERMAQSAGATMGPGGFLQGLWSAEGEDARKGRPQDSATATVTVQGFTIPPNPNPNYYANPSSPSNRVLQEHAPGQSLPQGLAAALSRLHLHGPRASSTLSRPNGDAVVDLATPGVSHRAGEDEGEDELFEMDG
ncbi:hypothetical protein P7C73_g4297, partial [Tremellales sp. Uapishka_1]